MGQGVWTAISQRIAEMSHLWIGDHYLLLVPWESLVVQIAIYHMLLHCYSRCCATMVVKNKVSFLFNSDTLDLCQPWVKDKQDSLVLSVILFPSVSCMYHKFQTWIPYLQWQHLCLCSQAVFLNFSIPRWALWNMLSFYDLMLCHIPTPWPLYRISSYAVVSSLLFQSAFMLGYGWWAIFLELYSSFYKAESFCIVSEFVRFCFRTGSCVSHIYFKFLFLAFTILGEFLKACQL